LIQPSLTGCCGGKSQSLFDQRKWKRAVAQQKKNAAVLTKVATIWDTIARRYG